MYFELRTGDIFDVNNVNIDIDIIISKIVEKSKE